MWSPWLYLLFGSCAPSYPLFVSSTIYSKSRTTWSLSLIKAPYYTCLISMLHCVMTRWRRDGVSPPLLVCFVTCLYMKLSCSLSRNFHLHGNQRSPVYIPVTEIPHYQSFSISKKGVSLLTLHYPHFSFTNLKAQLLWITEAPWGLYTKSNTTDFLLTIISPIMYRLRVPFIDIAWNWTYHLIKMANPPITYSIWKILVSLWVSS